MKNYSKMLYGVTLLVIFGACGCGERPAANDAELKKAFGTKTWSINDVPPEQRARVAAFMKASGRPVPPQTPSPNANPPASKP